MNKSKKPTAKSRKPGGKKEPIRDLGLSQAEASRVKGGQGIIISRKAGGTQE